MIPTGLTGVIKNLDKILEVNELLTPETMSLLSSINDVDLKEVSAAATVLSAYGTEIQTVHNGLSDIERVVEMQNQVHFLSDARQNIGLVAGKIEEIEKISDNINGLDNLALLVPKIEEIIDMRNVLDEVIDMKDEIDATNFIAESMRDDMFKIEKIQKELDRSLSRMNDMEKHIEKRYKQIKEIESNINKLDIEVIHTGHNDMPISDFDKDKMILSLQIPEGKTGQIGRQGIQGEPGPQGKPGTAVAKGEQGLPGRDGADFSPTAFGTMAERSRYNNRPPGTSYVVLDSIPAMVYFRIGNNSGNWTVGQPFGFTEINPQTKAEDSERLGGYTIAELMQFIQQKIKG